MNVELLIRAGVDYAGGVKRFMGRAQIYEKVLSKFPQDNTMERISADYLSGNIQGLLHNVHELKGMCGNMALTRPFDAAEALVQLLRQDAFSQTELDQAYELLEREHRLAREAVLAAMEGAL